MKLKAKIKRLQSNKADKDHSLQYDQVRSRGFLSSKIPWIPVPRWLKLKSLVPHNDMLFQSIFRQRRYGIQQYSSSKVIYMLDFKMCMLIGTKSFRHQRSSRYWNYNKLMILIDYKPQIGQLLGKSHQFGKTNKQWHSEVFPQRPDKCLSQYFDKLIM